MRLLILRSNNTQISFKSKHFKLINRKLIKDIKCVSEAIGTILLLAIAIVLVGVIGIWIQSFDQPEEVINVDLTANFENSNVYIFD